VDPYGLTGQVLDGQFRVDAPIGEGGFSVVYRGQHLGLHEPIAIKCLKLQQQLGSALVESFVQRFRDEGRLQYKLSQGSLYIARTLAAGTTMAPATMALVPYMVLEWLDGYTLSAELAARSQRGERGRSLKEVIKLLDPVADAMAYAHSLGVVHRDINPSNIFVASLPGGGFKLKVMDFGVAKVLQDHLLSLGPRAATLGQIKMFTPAYGAPEQFDDKLGPIGPWTDVYAFALMLVELLQDKSAFDGENLGEFLDQATNPHVRPTPRSLGIQVGDRVEAIMRSALDVNPRQRPGDIGEFWGSLKHAAQTDDPARWASQIPPATSYTTAELRKSTNKGTLVIPDQEEKQRLHSTKELRKNRGKGQTVLLPDTERRLQLQSFEEDDTSVNSAPPVFSERGPGVPISVHPNVPASNEHQSVPPFPRREGEPYSLSYQSQPPAQLQSKVSGSALLPSLVSTLKYQEQEHFEAAKQDALQRAQAIQNKQAEQQGNYSSTASKRGAIYPHSPDYPPAQADRSSQRPHTDHNWPVGSQENEPNPYTSSEIEQMAPSPVEFRSKSEPPLPEIAMDKREWVLRVLTIFLVICATVVWVLFTYKWLTKH
jgi:serine/threonine protein kinase